VDVNLKILKFLFFPFPLVEKVGHLSLECLMFWIHVVVSL
jgi:hypothetical protein